jgi:hypothetical protein
MMRAATAILFAVILMTTACQTGTQPNQVNSLRNGALPVLAPSKSRIFIFGDTTSSGNFVSPMAMLNDRPLVRIYSRHMYVIDLDADKTILLRTELSGEHSPLASRVRTYGFYNATPKAGEELYFQLKYTGQSDTGMVIAGDGGRVRSYNFTRIDAEEARVLMPALPLAYYSSL